MSFRPIAETADILGESPIWDAGRKCLWWIDIIGGLLHRFDQEDARLHTTPLSQPCGSIGLRKGGGLVAASWPGFGLIDPDTGGVTELVNILGTRDAVRFNDGRVGPDGRFWAGTVQKQTGGSAFYRFDVEHRATEVLGGITVSNGLTWSPDGRTMYLADSDAHVIYAFDFDSMAGTIDNRRVFIEYPAEYGVPDGATTDTDGNVWSATFGGWHVLKITPDDKIDRAIRMPVQYVTSVAFGGPELRTLYVTSARRQMEGDELAAQPLAGQLFEVDTGGAQGIADPEYLG